MPGMFTPLEHDHLGQYVAVSPDGEPCWTDDLLTLADAAVEQLGLGSFVSRLARESVGKWL